MTIRWRSWLLPPAALMLIFGILVGRNIPEPWLALVACISLLLAVLISHGLLRMMACLMLALAMGVISGSLAWHHDLPPEGEYEIRGIVSDEIKSGNFGQVRVELSDVALNGRDFPGGAYWTFYLSDEEEFPAGLEPGRMVTFHASLYHPAGADNPDGYDFREDLLRRGIWIGVYGYDNLNVTEPDFFSLSGFAASVRHLISGTLVRRMGNEAGGYVAALLFGQRSLIPSEDRAAFSRLGIAHILSVSGFHVGILIALMALLMRPFHPRPGVRFSAYALILSVYCVLCGMNQPVVRASLLLLITLGARAMNRPRTGLHSLCAVLFVMLLFDPVQITGVSFQMTFAAVLGLTLVTPWLAGLNPFRRSVPRWLWNSAAVVIGAQLGVLLPELVHYQTLPLLGFVVNIPATLYASALITLCWLILVFLPVPVLSGFLTAAGSASISALTGSVRFLASIPGIALRTPAPTWVTAAGVLLALIACCALFRFSWKPRVALLGIGISLIVSSFLPVPHTATEYIQFSVGNADAAVLWDGDQVIVMDTGQDDGVLSSFLRRRGLTPDAVILTHLHSDHAGGLRSMIDDEIPVPVIYLPAGAEDQQIHEDILSLLAELRASGAEFRYLSRGDVLPLPSGSLAVLWPEAGKIRRGQDANRYSLVSVLTLKGVTFLHTGDIVGEYEDYSCVPADLLKAAHHGSSGSSSESYLSAVSPRMILLSCDSETRHQNFAQRLPSGSELWSTAVNGALTLRFDDRKVTIIPFISP